jgi:hypothetical protein
MHHRTQLGLQLGFWSPDQATAAAATQTASGGGILSSIIGGIQAITQPAVEGGRSILDSISASYLNYRGTRDAQKENLERARQGLPPIDATPLPSTAPPPPAAGQGVDSKTLLRSAGVLAAVALLLVARPS